MKPVAILQARCSSFRLPGKVLMPLLGQPMLLRQIERLRRCRELGELVVATSTDAADDALAALCESEGVACYRGSLDDVLDRFYRAARAFPADAVVRLTGDCPLADADVIDHVVRSYCDSGADYASNTLNPTYPDGLDVEVCSMRALETAWTEARLPSEREHVTPFIHGRPERFNLFSVEQAPNLAALRWTVDTAEDFAFVEAVYERLFPANPLFSQQDVLHLLANEPHLAAINQGFKRNEGLLKSLQADAAFTDKTQEGKQDV